MDDENKACSTVMVAKKKGGERRRRCKSGEEAKVPQGAALGYFGRKQLAEEAVHSRTSSASIKAHRRSEPSIRNRPIQRGSGFSGGSSPHLPLPSSLAMMVPLCVFVLPRASTSPSATGSLVLPGMRA